MEAIVDKKNVGVEASAKEALEAAAEIVENLSREDLLLLRGYAAGLKANLTNGGEKRHGSG